MAYTTEGQNVEMTPTNYANCEQWTVNSEREHILYVRLFMETKLGAKKTKRERPAAFIAATGY